MKNILVTGGAGFIGNHLCRKLLENKDNYVICLDNLYTGRLSNITDLMNCDRFEFIRHDITEKILLEVNEIYHLACPASPRFYQNNPIKTVKTNVIGTINVLGIAKRVNAKILLTSTSEIYGDPLEHPQREEYKGNTNMIGIRSCYDEGKRVAETLFMDYHREHNVDIRICRIFNTYGPNMCKDDGRVVSNFINQAINNNDITIYGNGIQTRCLCYVSDMVEGIIKLMNSDYCNPVNLGSNNELTIGNIASKILDLTHSNSKIINCPLPKDDPKKRCPDLNKANNILHWNPIVNLDEGLTKTIEYFESITN
jgi:UDP-glucuronate decarboxylase